MMEFKIAIVAFTIAVILMILLIIYGRIQKNSKTEFEKEIAKKRRESIDKRKKGWDAKKIYNIYIKIPILKNFVIAFRQELSMIGEKDNIYLVKKVVNIMTSCIVTYTVFIIVFYQLTKNVLYTLVFAFFLWYISDSYFDYFLSKGKERLLTQTVKFLTYVRQKFYEYKIVDDAIYAAIEELDEDDREMAFQGELIYNIFMESDREKAIVEYSEIAPNPYLKMFVNLSNMIMEYGDQKKDDTSVYLTNLGFLKKSIELEIDKRKKLNYALKSMNVIVMLPLLLISLVKKWSIANFAPLAEFYQSVTGKYIEILAVAIILISMILLNRISNLDHGGNRIDRLENLIKKIKVPINYFHKKKWIYAIITFLMSILIIASIEYGAKIGIQNKIYYSNQFFGNMEQEEKQVKLMESREDYNFITKNFKSLNDEDIEKYLSEKMKGMEETAEFNNRKDEIKEKIDIYSKANVKWWEIIIAIAISIMAYYIPELNITISKKIKAMDIDDEVAGFRSLIMVLIHNPRMNVETIIEWMYDYARYYEGDLHKCSLNISAGEKEALIKLKEEVEHEDMKRIAGQLSMASDGITIEEAFDELISEKNNFFEQRKWQNDKIINRKILLGQAIGFAPSYALIIFYMIVPMIISSTNELNYFYESLF